MAEQTHIPRTNTGNLARKRLLFVDDEPSIRAMLPVILRRYGFTVTVAATVGEAIAQIQNHGFDLLLCDLNIEREGDEGIHLRIDDYIIKPSNADALVALLANKLLAPHIPDADS